MHHPQAPAFCVLCFSLINISPFCGVGISPFSRFWFVCVVFFWFCWLRPACTGRLKAGQVGRRLPRLGAGLQLAGLGAGWSGWAVLEIQVRGPSVYRYGYGLGAGWSGWAGGRLMRLGLG